MNTGIITTVGLGLLGLVWAAGLALYRDLRREEQFASRVRVIHGHPPVARSAEPEVIRAAIIRHAGKVGQAILSSGLVPARTRAEQDFFCQNIFPLYGGVLTSTQAIERMSAVTA